MQYAFLQIIALLLWKDSRQSYPLPSTLFSRAAQHAERPIREGTNESCRFLNTGVRENRNNIKVGSINCFRAILFLFRADFRAEEERNAVHCNRLTIGRDRREQPRSPGNMPK